MNSNKKFLSIALLLSFPAIYAAEPNKAVVEAPKTETAEHLVIRYANSMEIMGESEQGKEFQREVMTTKEELTAKAKKEEEQFKTAINDYENKKSTLSKSAQASEEAKIEAKQRSFESNLKTYERELNLKGQEAGEQLTTSIKSVATEIAEKNGYDAILDIGTGQPIYMSEKALITDEIINGMNKTYKKPAAKTVKK